MAKMPLLEHVKSFHPSTSLSNVLLIGCQHVLATTHSMLQSLYSSGLNPKNVFLLGKCYSSSGSVWQEMHQDGIHVSPLSFSFESNQTFDSQFCRIVAQFLENTLSQLDLSKFHKIILIDDGGQLLSLSMEFFRGQTNVVAIEQTTSGYEKVKSSVLQFPIINVARSQAKLIYESPMIAETVVKKAIKRMDTLKHTPGKILIIGNGAIGSSIYATLKNNYEVQIYDKNLNNNLSLDEHLRTVDLVIGCTGETSLPFGKHKYLKKGCILFSASSSDREFDAVHFRKKTEQIRSCHDDIEVDGKTILNCGFPVNFDGGRNSVAPSKIQLTRALLMSAILQACEMSDTSFEIVPLDIEMQRDIIRKFLQIYPASAPNAEQLIEYRNSIFDQKALVSRK
jgi:S-adenosylhomocysteine hydrolase